ncbi:hypothetical protein H311_04000 [Anncaliia algerae PRA109]|nr:hypothetical protein H311_04000 [Anncaliia algerae PRA109]
MFDKKELKNYIKSIKQRKRKRGKVNVVSEKLFLQLAKSFEKIGVVFKSQVKGHKFRIRHSEKELVYYMPTDIYKEDFPFINDPEVAFFHESISIQSEYYLKAMVRNNLIRRAKYFSAC